MEGFFSQLNHVIISVYEKIERVETLMNERNEMDLSINEIHILEKIGENSGINIRDLAMLLSVTTATVTVAIQKLQKKGYVLKEKSRSDLRGVTLSLTEAGVKVVRLHHIFHIRMVRSMTSGLSEEEVRTLRESLLKLNGHLDEFLDSKKL
ncbi:MarR family transcriptional regulator [Proteiniclasticum sp. QWL-01]|uniref:MarR family winged helix-turn-helix transcriptional regulator n=1 Tax=Proteiniclasticum sp. QWL-01 TaxID=3036945 RepID=UPI0022013F14|nr:MarR family transcriptional regulator [Proteiniclasticum sp. QWL-01]UUM13039.1 MarR family transcriptional regulator [Clostridiaceae bacterium HFYG-1003]WFF71464.1 MarR family transcriptional regulator [Proteiniclasticum sp. QWL-01]